MTYSKSKNFDRELQKAALMAKALSHPARLAILLHLAACKTCISGDISGQIPLSRTTVSQHLQELKNAGLIQGEISGVSIHYCLSPEGIQALENWFGGFLNTLKSGIASC